MNKLFVKLIICLMFSFGLLAQNEKLIHNFKSNNKFDSSLIVINEIEESIKYSDVLKLAKYINSQTYFSLLGNLNGYYTTNQAFYILEDFLKTHKIQSFKFNQVSSDANNPYATGTLYYENKGRRNKSQVYISLKRIGENWIISQLSIN